MSGPAEGAPPSEEELRAAYEAELARITAVDMIAQSAVSLLNIGARRLGPPGVSAAEAAAAGRDLDQVSDAIDGARALLAILEKRIPAEIAPLKDALSRLQMTYAQEVGAGAAPATQSSAASEPPQGGGGEQAKPDAQAPAPGAPQSEPDPSGQRGPGPAESSGRLWVPGR